MQIVSVNRDDFFDSKSNIQNMIWSKVEEKILDILQQKPFGDRKFYLYIFPKRNDEISHSQILFYQPRLTRPDPLPGTTLIKLNPKREDEAIIIWTLPHQEAIDKFKKGKIYENRIVHESIQDFLYNRNKLIQPDVDDPNDEECRRIYREVTLKAS